MLPEGQGHGVIQHDFIFARIALFDIGIGDMSDFQTETGLIGKLVIEAELQTKLKSAIQIFTPPLMITTHGQNGGQHPVIPGNICIKARIAHKAAIGIGH